MRVALRSDEHEHTQSLDKIPLGGSSSRKQALGIYQVELALFREQKERSKLKGESGLRYSQFAYSILLLGVGT